MNFYDLNAKLKSIEESAINSSIDECGCDSPMSAPKQQDNVTMNLTMNGTGAGGIKDLLDVIRHIESGAPSHGHHDADDVLVGIGAEEGFDNEPNPQVASANAVTPTGDDLSSKGAEAEKVNGGGNPFNVDESLVNRLANLYNEVKSR